MQKLFGLDMNNPQRKKLGAMGVLKKGDKKAKEKANDDLRKLIQDHPENKKGNINIIHDLGLNQDKEVKANKRKRSRIHDMGI